MLAVVDLILLEVRGRIDGVAIRRTGMVMSEVKPDWMIKTVDLACL